MAVSMWNSACASIRFGVTSCLGTCYSHEFYTWAAAWSIKGTVSISCFPLRIYSGGHLLGAVCSMHSKCFLSPSPPLPGGRLLARFVLLHWLVGEMCNYSIYGGDGRKYHLWRSKNISFLDHLVLVKVKNYVGSSVGIFFPSQIAACAVVLTSIPSYPSVLPKKSK